MKKEYTITYKFSDVIDNIEAESLEEAQKIADERLEDDNSPLEHTYVYDTEIEEIENE